MEESIFSKVKTTESSEIFKDELKLLLRSLYLGVEEFNSVLRTKVRAHISEYIIRKISEKDIDVEKYLKTLIHKVEKIPSVRLVVAYEPSEDAIERFYSFISAACQRHILLDIGFSPDIIGGAVVIYQGKYRDFSFKYVFEKEFESERENILKLIQK